METEAEIWSVEEWLKRIGMTDYTEGFVDNGYETVELVAKMKAEDLDAVGVKSKKDRGILFMQARMLLEETTGIRLPPSPRPSRPPAPAPVITLSMSGSVSPTTPSNTSDYSEPWDNNSQTPQAPLQSPLQSPLETAEYSEPWNATTPKSNGSIKTIETTDSGSVDIKPPPLPPPNKGVGSTKGKKPPPSPGIKLPEYKREDGEKGFTKLQLKLKIRDELQKDSLVLSEFPFCSDTGGLNEEQLVSLAEDYASRFKVESLGVYDALKDVWRHQNNTSDFATPSNILKGGPSDNYDEPFDSQVVPTTTVVKLTAGSASPKEKNATKSHALSPTTTQPTYEEPFDTVKTPKSSPQVVKTPRLDLPSAQSKTLPSPKIQKKSADSEDKTKDSGGKGLGRLFRRKEKARARSVKDELTKVFEDEPGKKGKKQARIIFPDKSKSVKSKRKRSSTDHGKEEEEDTLGDMAVVPRGGRSGSKGVRASVAGYPVHNGISGASPKHRRSFDSGSSGPSESDESPQQRKKYGGRIFQKFKTPPTLTHNQPLKLPVSSDSDDDKTPPALRRLKQISSKRMSGSDLELDVSDDDSKGWMQASKSYDNLTAALRDSKKPEKKGLLSRLRNLRKTYARKSSKDKHKGSDSGADTSGAEIARVNSLTASMSMPDIASLSILDRQPSIPEDIPVIKRSPAKPSRSFKRSPLSSQSHTPQHTPPEQRTMPVLASSVPTESSHFSSGSCTPDIPMVRTRSSGSAKSLDKPPPPPKPSTLTRKPKPTGKTSPKGAAPQMVTTVNADNPSKNNKGSSTSLEAANAKTNDEAMSKAGPPKPMRKSIKREGVTEKVRKELEDKSSRAGNVPPSPKEEKVVPTKTDDTSLLKGLSDNHTPSGTPSVTPPPPKPSRNYKSVKILTRPPDKPALSVKPVVEKNTDGGENIKPSELLRRSHSPAADSPDHTPSLSQSAGNSQEDGPPPKTRKTVYSSKKPSPPSKPSKPPRKSIKLKTAN